ncbi:MAG: hypothetical protein N3A00_00400 [Thermodesulfovibrio sp.]|nr:hypothetical protein [Thermodesulfovibrio sp.]
MRFYIHDIPGRLRIKSPLLKNNQKAEWELRKALSTLEGIGVVETNLITGSILINYNFKRINKNDIIRLLTNRGYFDPAKAVTNDEYIKKTFEKTGNFVVKSLVGTVVDSSLENTPLRFISVLI